MEFKKDGIDHYYELREELGRGQFAVVSLCLKKATGEKFAAKCIQKKTSSLLSAARGVEMRTIRQEVEILHELAHENVVKLFDVFESRSTVTLVLEYVEGGELFALVSERERLDEDEASGFVRQLLTGAAYLHTNNIAHLDLKPENIMLEHVGVGPENGHIVKIIDFGLAQRMVNGQPISIEPHGTAEFIPPEVLACELVSTSADLWMVGVIVYVLLSGVSPFAAENDGATFARILVAQYSFSEEFSNVSDLAKDLIYKLIQRKPTDRLTAVQALAHPWINPQSSEQRLLRKRSKVKRENLLRLKRYVSPRTRWKQTLGVIKVVNRLARSRRNRTQSANEAASNAQGSCETQTLAVASSANEASVPVVKADEAEAEAEAEAKADAERQQPPDCTLNVTASVPNTLAQEHLNQTSSHTNSTHELSEPEPPLAKQTPKSTEIAPKTTEVTPQPTKSGQVPEPAQPAQTTKLGHVAASKLAVAPKPTQPVSQPSQTTVEQSKATSSAPTEPNKHELQSSQASPPEVTLAASECQPCNSNSSIQVPSESCSSHSNKLSCESQPQPARALSQPPKFLPRVLQLSSQTGALSMSQPPSQLQSPCNSNSNNTHGAHPSTSKANSASNGSLAVNKNMAKVSLAQKPELHKRGSGSLNTALLNIRSLLKPVSKQQK